MQISDPVHHHLSGVWLTRFALQELDRRTVQLIIPKPKYPSDFEGDSTLKLFNGDRGFDGNSYTIGAM